jgi:hypothetical protein
VTTPPSDVHDVYVHVVDTGPLLRRLARIEVLLARIERAVITEGEIMTDVPELDADLAALAQQIAADDADLARELADFAAVLTDDEQARLAGLAQKLTDFRAAADVADPVPAPPAEPAV